ncbi:MAG: YpmA family protein [Clostridiales bacterium]|nr:YpmA family protein [Clostridiales bacterium]MCF8021985.1 YpmA family protein [Clostridiales bacterium]
MDQSSSGKLEIIASKKFNSYSDMYKIVDFLNKNLKDKKIMLGLSKTEEGDMLISIYET